MGARQRSDWKPVPGYRGQYQVSSGGNIRRRDTGRVLQPGLDKDGYPQVNLSKDGKRTTIRVHRLVARAFKGPRPDGKVIDHRDRRRTNARSGNLRFVTRSKNSKTEAVLSSARTILLEGRLSDSQRRAIFAKIARSVGSSRVAGRFLQQASKSGRDSAVVGRLKPTLDRQSRNRLIRRERKLVRQSRNRLIRRERKLVRDTAPTSQIGQQARLAFSKAFTRAKRNPPAITKVTPSPAIKTLDGSAAQTQFRLKDQFGTPFAHVSLTSNTFTQKSGGGFRLEPLSKASQAEVSILPIHRSGRASKLAGSMGTGFSLKVSQTRNIIRSLKARFPNLKMLFGTRRSGASEDRIAALQLAQFQDRVGILLQELVA